jgi:hypothetical protein
MPERTGGWRSVRRAGGWATTLPRVRPAGRCRRGAACRAERHDGLAVGLAVQGATAVAFRVRGPVHVGRDVEEALCPEEVAVARLRHARARRSTSCNADTESAVASRTFFVPPSLPKPSATARPFHGRGFTGTVFPTKKVTLGWKSMSPSSRTAAMLNGHASWSICASGRNEARSRWGLVRLGTVSAGRRSCSDAASRCAGPAPRLVRR